MSMNEQRSTNRTSFTIVVVVVLIAAAIAYSQGWLNWSRSNDGMESNTVRAEQKIDEEKAIDDSLGSTREAAKPANTVTE
jgi:hypothetical protein